jgi:hypothetical protein
VVKEETPAPRQLSERPVTQVNPFTVEDIDVIDRLISGTAPLNEASEAQVEEALARLDDKTRAVTQEFSSGRINQAQFQAIFTRYREQREIIKRMMSRNPDSDAWKTVAAEGVTNILRKQHSALVAGFVILNKKNGGLIKKLGTFSVKADLMVGLLDSLSDAEALAPPVVTQIEGGRYLALAQGYVTATIILYSSEPPQASLAQLKHLHEEFEFSNNPYLHENEIPVEKLVYPQSQLLTGLP